MDDGIIGITEWTNNESMCIEWNDDSWWFQNDDLCLLIIAVPHTFEYSKVPQNKTIRMLLPMEAAQFDYTISFDVSLSLIDHFTDQ